ncbi:MAG: hypothetical protein HYS13_06205 [Planctomycetia bacterium]|nr:hypothetical protein [Planctomycetia bacterium]
MEGKPFPPAFTNGPFCNDRAADDEALERSYWRSQRKLYKIGDDAIKRGDVTAFFRWIVESGNRVLGVAEQFARLYKVIQQRSRTDPDGLADEILHQGAGLLDYLLLRVQYMLEYRLGLYDAELPNTRELSLPNEVVTNLLPRYLDLHRHLAEYASLRAGTLRLRALADAKRRDSSPPCGHSQQERTEKKPASQRRRHANGRHGADRDASTDGGRGPARGVNRVTAFSANGHDEKHT